MTWLWCLLSFLGGFACGATFVILRVVSSLRKVERQAQQMLNHFPKGAP